MLGFQEARDAVVRLVADEDGAQQRLLEDGAMFGLGRSAAVRSAGLQRGQDTAIDLPDEQLRHAINDSMPPSPVGPHRRERIDAAGTPGRQPGSGQHSEDDDAGARDRRYVTDCRAWQKELARHNIASLRGL